MDHRGELLGALNRDFSYLAADLFRVVVHRRHDPKGAVREVEEMGQRLTQVAAADDDDRVCAIEAEQLIEARGEIGDPIADAPHPELPKVGEILPNLGGGEVQTAGESLRRDRLDSLLAQVAENPEVQRESIESEGGDRVRSASHRFRVRSARPAGPSSGGLREANPGSGSRAPRVPLPSGPRDRW